jgi:hypothetical protein
MQHMLNRVCTEGCVLRLLMGTEYEVLYHWLPFPFAFSVSKEVEAESVKSFREFCSFESM